MTSSASDWTAAGSQSQIPESSAVQKVVHQHLSHRHLTELIDYPEHGPRNIAAFNKLTHARVIKGNEGCFICGITHADVSSDPKIKDIYGAIQLHHVLVQFALQDGVDVEKWNKEVIPMFNKGVIWNPNACVLKSPMTKSEIQDFVNFGSGNLVPLCYKHHLGKYTGIHNLSYPMWIAQKYLQPRYLPENQTQYKNEITPNTDSRS